MALPFSQRDGRGAPVDRLRGEVLPWWSRPLPGTPAPNTPVPLRLPRPVRIFAIVFLGLFLGWFPWAFLHGFP